MQITAHARAFYLHVGPPHAADWFALVCMYTGSCKEYAYQDYMVARFAMRQLLHTLPSIGARSLLCGGAAAAAGFACSLT